MPAAPESPAFATARRAALGAAEPPLEKGRGGGARARAWRRPTSTNLSLRCGHERRVRRVQRVDGVTCPAPFALATDRRGERRVRAGAARAKGAAEGARARAAVAARPAPKTSSSRRRSRLPEPVFKPPTVCEPFRLRGEALSAYEKSHQQKALRKEEEETTRRRRFVAAPLPDSTHRASFVAKKSDAPLTTPAEDVLAAGARRAAERAAFDAELATRAS